MESTNVPTSHPAAVAFPLLAVPSGADGGRGPVDFCEPPFPLQQTSQGALVGLLLPGLLAFSLADGASHGFLCAATGICEMYLGVAHRNLAPVVLGLQYIGLGLGMAALCGAGAAGAIFTWRLTAVPATCIGAVVAYQAAQDARTAPSF